MSHLWLCFSLLIGNTLVLSKTYSSRTDDDEAYLKFWQKPDPGPESPDTIYKPGTPGAPWTKEEIDSTRLNFIFFKFSIFPHFTLYTKNVHISVGRACRD